MAGENLRQQQDRGDLGEFRGLDIEASDVDPALGAQGTHTNQAHRDQAGDHGPIDRPGPAGDALHRNLGEQQGDDQTNGGRHPVLVPIGVTGLALGTGDQKARDENHRQGDPPEDLVDTRKQAATASIPFEEQASAAAIPEARERHQRAATGRRDASAAKAAAVADSGALTVTGRPPSPPCTTANSIGS